MAIPGNMSSNGSDRSQDNSAARALFERYEIDSRFFDETFESESRPRAHYRMLIDAMREMPRDEVERLQDRVTRSFLHEGITLGWHIGVKHNPVGNGTGQAQGLAADRGQIERRFPNRGGRELGIDQAERPDRGADPLTRQ